MDKAVCISLKRFFFLIDNGPFAALILDFQKSPSSDFIWRGTSSLAVGRFAAKHSLRSMAVLSSRAHERQSREIHARSARERAVSLPSRVYYLARPTKTAMPHRLGQTRLAPLAKRQVYSNFLSCKILLRRLLPSKVFSCKGPFTYFFHMI